MAITSKPWSSTNPCAAERMLVQLPFPVLTALADGDLETAKSHCEYNLTPYLITDECLHVWKMRRHQITADQLDAVWVTRLIIPTETGAVVGRAGFHGPPDGNGTVEVGYSIDPKERRLGHARAALLILLDMARKDDRVKTVRASVRPDNVISRALVEREGFSEVGEQWDEVDGLEKVFEISVER
jgi:ribosomal-protein-alanine N-acetyltransferase